MFKPSILQIKIVENHKEKEKWEPVKTVKNRKQEKRKQQV